MKARRCGTDRAPGRDVNVIVELVERALEIGVVTDARSHLDQPRRYLHPVTMRRNVVEIWIRPARWHGDEDCSDASHETNGQSRFHLRLQDLDVGAAFRAAKLARKLRLAPDTVRGSARTATSNWKERRC